MNEMVKKEELYMPSGNAGQILHGIAWEPEKGRVKAILQIVHGMVEYVDRYDAFACYLAQKGYAVIGHDHLGHGKTAKSQEELGYFSENDGEKHVIGDIYRVSVYARERWAGVPLFILGHSMGSYFTRQYLTKYSRKVDGAIIMGTGFMSSPVCHLAYSIANLICRTRGDRYRSRLLFKLSLGNNNRRIEAPQTANDWLTKDARVVERYNADPFCTFVFTAGAYRDFFSILVNLADEKNLEHMNRKLPILLVSGEEDPVGDYGKGVKKCFDQFKKLGFQDASMKLYLGDRHEILNELDRELIYDDLYGWLEERREKSK